MNDTISCEFTRADLVNLMNLLKRATYQGLDEAVVGVQLAQKVDAFGQQPAKVKVPEVSE